METQANQTNIINPPELSTWRTVKDNWQIIIGVIVGIGFMFVTYDQFKDLSDDMVNVKKDLKEKVEIHEFKDLDEKVSRQWTTQNESINRVRAEFNPVRDWVEWRKGYDQALKDMKK